MIANGSDWKMAEYKYQYVLDALKDFSNEVSDVEISLAFVGALITDFPRLHYLNEYGFDVAYEIASEINNDIHRGVFCGSLSIFRACFDEDCGCEESGIVWIKPGAVDVSRLDQYRKITFYGFMPIVEYVAGCIENRSDAWTSRLAGVVAQKVSISKNMPTYAQAMLELNKLRLKFSQPESADGSFSERLSERKKQSQSAISSAKKKPASRNKARVLSLWLALVTRDGYEKTAGLTYKEFSRLSEMSRLRVELQDGYADSTIEKDFSGWNKGSRAAFNDASLELLEEMLSRLVSPKTGGLDDDASSQIRLPQVVSEVLKGQDVVERIVTTLQKRGHELPGFFPVTAVAFR